MRIELTPEPWQGCTNYKNVGNGGFFAFLALLNWKMNGKWQPDGLAHASPAIPFPSVLVMVSACGWPHPRQPKWMLIWPNELPDRQVWRCVQARCPRVESDLRHLSCQQKAVWTPPP